MSYTIYRTFTVIADVRIQFIICLVMEMKWTKNIKKYTIKQLRILPMTNLRHCLEDNSDKNILKCCTLPTFLEQFRNIEHEICICVAQLPPRLHGGDAQGQQPDYGEAEGLRIQVPDLLLDPNNPFTAIRARIQRPIENNRETGAGGLNRNRPDNRDGRDYRNRPDNRDGMDVRGVAEADVSQNASGNMRGIISVKVRHCGSDIIFQVQKGMLVADFVRSDDFIKRVTDKWNILEADLQNMVLRQHGGHVIEKLELDCRLRLELGHMDLFC